METAFVVTPSLYRGRVGNSFACSPRVFPRARLASKWRMAQNESETKTENGTSSAERTRQALSKDKPMVKFSREPVDEGDQGFNYTSGVQQGGVDIWLITGALVILVPLAIFAWGISTGNIDVNPR